MNGNFPRRHAALACMAVAGLVLTTACSKKDNARANRNASTSTASADTAPSTSSLGGRTPVESTRTDDLTPSTETRTAAPSSTTRRRTTPQGGRNARRVASTSIAPTTESRAEVTVGVPADSSKPANPASTAAPANPNANVATQPFPCDSLANRTPQDTVGHIVGCAPRDSVPANPVNPPATPATPATPANPANPNTPVTPTPVTPAPDSTPDDPSEPNRTPVTPSPDSARDTTGRNPLDVNDEREMAPSLANDLRIANLLVVANRLDSAAAALVVANGSNADVKAFAEMMVRDHGQANQSIMTLVRRIDATPAAPADTVAAMREVVDETVRTLEGKTGAEFDRAYIEAEVRMHQDAIAKLDRELPRVQNAELKALIEQSRTTMQAHLERARQIQGSLGR